MDRTRGTGGDGKSRDGVLGGCRWIRRIILLRPATAKGDVEAGEEVDGESRGVIGRRDDRSRKHGEVAKHVFGGVERRGRLRDQMTSQRGDRRNGPDTGNASNGLQEGRA